MSIDFDKLFNPRKEQIKTDTTEIDEILEQEEILYIISKNIILYRKDILQEIINSLNKFNCEYTGRRNKQCNKPVTKM